MAQIDHSTGQTQINVTPLVDVMLVLLIIFMVTTPMMQSGVNINLPKAKQAAPLNQSKKSIVVSVTKAGKIYVDKQMIGMDTLLKRVDELTTKDRTQIIQVKGDQDMTYGRMFEVMNKLVTGGYQKISLVAESQ